MKTNVDELVPVNEKVIVFDSTGKNHEDMRLLKDKRILLFNLVNKLAIKDKPFPNRGLYTYKGNVRVNLEKVEKDIQNYENLSSDLKIACGQLTSSIRRSIKQGTFLEDFNINGVSDRYSNSLMPKDIIPILFHQNNDVITFLNMAGDRVSVFKTDFELYKELRKKNSNARSLYLVAKETGYTTEDLKEVIKLPIDFRELPYINIDEYQSFIRLRFSSTTEDVEDKTNVLLNTFIGLLERQEGVFLVNLKAHKMSIRLNLLCDKDKIGTVLDLLGKSYKRYNHPFVDNYVVEIEVTKNIGLEEETIEYYSIIEGSHFKPVKDMLQPTNETLCGFPVYR